MAKAIRLYTVMGLAPTATSTEIKQAYRALAKQLHPDLHPGDEENRQRFIEIVRAYDLLSVPEQRARYDRGEIDSQGRERLQKPQEAPEPKRSSSFWPFGRGDKGQGPKALPEAGGSSMADTSVIDNLLGASAQSGPTVRGKNVHLTLYVSFVEACMGIKKLVNFGGGKSGEIVLAPGSMQGTQRTFKGMGQPGFGNESAGDAVVDVTVEPHAFLTNRGLDIHMNLPVSLVEVVIGGTVKVPTLDGAVTLRIPEGSNTDTVLRLKAKGIQDTQKGTVGDQYVHLKVFAPDPPSQLVQDLARRLAETPGGDYGLELRRKMGLN